MKFDLTVESGPCKTELATWCFTIACFWLLVLTLNVVLHPTMVNYIGIVIAVLCNLSLLFGCKRRSPWLVAGWVVFFAIWMIGFPFAVLGVIFNFGDYRASVGTDSIFLGLIYCFISFAIMVFCGRLVYSHFLQLKNKQANQPSVMTA